MDNHWHFSLPRTNDGRKNSCRVPKSLISAAVICGDSIHKPFQHPLRYPGSHNHHQNIPRPFSEDPNERRKPAKLAGMAFADISWLRSNRAYPTSHVLQFFNTVWNGFYAIPHPACHHRLLAGIWGFARQTPLSLSLLDCRIGAGSSFNLVQHSPGSVLDTNINLPCTQYMHK